MTSRTILPAFLVSFALCSCTVLTEFDGYGHENDGAEDGGATADGGPSTGDGGERDGGERDAAASDASLPPGCVTATTDPALIGLGQITGAPDPLTNLPYAVQWTEGGGLAMAWITGGSAHVRSWDIDIAAETATLRGSVDDALTGLDTSGASIHLGWSASTSWIVLGRVGLGYAAASCGDSGCTSATGPAAEGPFAIAQGDDDFVLVHTAEGPDFSTLWAASTWAGDTANLATASSSLVPFGAAARSDGYVAFTAVDELGEASTSFLWFARPPGESEEVESQPATGDAVGATYVTHDESTDTAIGVMATLEKAVVRSRVVAGRPGMTPAEILSWLGNPGPVVSRDDGTFLVLRPDGYALFDHTGGSAMTQLGNIDEPSAVSRPLVVAGRYAILSVHRGSTDELALRVFACE